MMRCKTKKPITRKTAIASCIVALLNIPTITIEAAGNFNTSALSIQKNNITNAVNFFKVIFNKEYQ